MLNHGNRLQSVSVQVNGKWVAATLADYNYWIYQPGAGPGPYTLLVKDIYGQQAIVSGVTMSPTLVQTTTARLKEAGDPGPVSRPALDRPASGRRRGTARPARRRPGSG